MDFIENINESYDMRYEEISETGNSVFIIKDIDNNVNHRFYPEDVQNLMDFLSCIKGHPNLELTRDLNESYNLKYHRDYNSIGDEYVLVLEDIDNACYHIFYAEDVSKIMSFFKRLKEFNVIKT